MACSAAMPICKFFSLKLIIILFNKATKRDKDGNLITTRAACRFRMMAYFRGQANKDCAHEKNGVDYYNDELWTFDVNPNRHNHEHDVLPMKESTFRHSKVSCY